MSSMESSSEYVEKAAFFSAGLVEPNDFALQCNDFLDKMKQSSAFELVKNIKKFISVFSQKQTPKPIEELVDEIRQFLDDTSLVIERHPLWRHASPEDTEIAAEALERYTMHKVHKSVYSPSREDDARRDREFVQQLESLSFVTPAMLDVSLCGPTCEAGWEVASNQLKKMESCKSPRDKVTCVMNLFTVLCKLLVEVQSGNAAGADDLLPNVIYTILRAKPAHWYSDVRYIQRFRHPGRLSSEAGYYMTQMMGAVAFLEKIEGHHISMSEEDFRKAKKGDYVPIANTRHASRETAGLERTSSDEAAATTTAAAFAVAATQRPVSGVGEDIATASADLRDGGKAPSGQRLSSSSTSSLHSNASRSSCRSSGSSPAGARRPTSSSSSRLSVNVDANGASSGDRVVAAAAETTGGRKLSAVALDLDNAPSSILSPLASVTCSPVAEAGIVERFLDCKFKELTIGDVTDLLKNYRILVHKYSTLRAQMATSSATTAQARLQAAQQCGEMNGVTHHASSGGGSSGSGGGGGGTQVTPPMGRRQNRSVSQPALPAGAARSFPANSGASRYAGAGAAGNATGGVKEDTVFISNPAASLN